ncbi:MAG: NADH-quinone oxidoreductase subunit NuoE [Anaerolineae bacterium]|nr:NADH-quinone oxidoreductase subunit NuoE [Anaerolineae bacterium]
MIREKYADVIQELFRRYPERKSAILPLMHIAQHEYGYMSEEAMQEVADILGLNPTHVKSIAGFYTLFYEEPVGKYVLEICNDLACALRGADEFVAMASNKLGVPVEGTTPDGLFTLKTVMCLGACDRAPMLQCNLRFHEHLNEEKFTALLDHLHQEASSDQVESAVVEKIVSYIN